jgi:hypothetical protein
MAICPFLLFPSFIVLAMTTDRRAYMQAHRTEAKARGVRRIGVTLSADEFDTLSRAALAHGEPPTAHLKRRAFAHFAQAYIVPPDQQERLDALLTILRGIGNNLNQLARHSNEMKYFLDTEFVRSDLKRMDAALRMFITAPPRAGDVPTEVVR